MKHIALTAALLSSIFFVGCKGNDYSGVDSPNALKYVVNGISEVTIDHKGSATLPLSVQRTSGQQESVTLSVTGLPGNATASFSPASGIPDYSTTLTINTNYTDGGTYNVQLVGTTAQGAKSTYPLKLIVNPEPAIGCAAAFIGSYSSKYEGDFSATQTDQVLATATKNYVKFQDMKYVGSFYGTLDCDAHTITLVKQVTNNGTWVKGTGTYDAKNVTLQMLIYNPNDTTQLIGNFNCYMSR